jgi:hypothetical protein
MGLLDDVGDFVSDGADAVGGAISDGADAVGDAVSDGADAVADVATSAYDRGTDAIETFGTGITSAFSGAFRDVLEGAETYAKGWGDLFDGRVADAFGDWYSGTFQIFGQTPIDAGLMIGARGVSAIETLGGIEPVGRKLSDAEIAELRKVYGDSIDYDKIRVKVGDDAMTVGGNARTIGNTIYIPEGKLTNDLLVHESGHVWQFQHGGDDYMGESLFAQTFGEGYDYQQGIDEGKSWSELNPEQQAELLQQAYKAGYFNSDPHTWPMNPQLTDYMRQVEQEVKAGRGAT